MNYELLKCGYYVCDKIATYINNTKLNSDKSFEDNDAINAFVKTHNLESIFGSIQTPGSFNNNVSGLIIKQIKLEHMCDKISDEFCKHKVRHIVLKGKEFQRFYPESIIRSSADIDFYIDHKDTKKANEILTQLGFLHHKTQHNNEFQYIKEPVYNVEIHTTMGGFSNKQKETLDSLKKNTTTQNSYRCSLDDTAFFVYSLFHLYKHFVTSGVGVRLFLDLYLVQKNGNINYEYAEKTIKELDIEGFYETVQKINHVLFENQTSSAELNEVIEFIFDSGTFGKDITTLHLNKFNYSTKHMSKFERFKHKHGIGFEAMSKRYPVLKKAPVLYPFSFVYRLFYGVLFRREVLKASRKIQKSLSDEDTNKYKRIFDIAKIK